jgi:hypothetical protein
MAAPKLTHKQQVFVEEYAASHNGTQAALTAYDTEDPVTAAVIAYENLRKPQIVDALEEALPEKMLLQVHKEGLFATRTVFDKTGQAVGEDADFAVRSKYLDMAYKLKGTYAPEKKLVGVVHQKELDPRIRELAKKLNQAT